MVTHLFMVALGMLAVGSLEHRFVAMGTDVILVIEAPVGTAQWAAAVAAAEAEFSRLDALLTTWPHPGWSPSAILQLNAAAGQGPPGVSLSAEVMALLGRAQALSVASDGAFDVTVGGLAGLWQFDADWRPQVPLPAALALARRRLGYADLILNAPAGRAWLRRPGMAVTLGGIGKGYAVDRAAEQLRRHGLDHFTVQAGGDLYVAGQRGGRPWRVGLRDPRGGGGHLASLPLQDAALSTAGDNERAFVLGGLRYHHILDPATGYPASACRSVAVRAPSALLADCLSDALFVLGPARGLELLRQFPGTDAALLDAESQLWVSPGLAADLRQLRPAIDVP